MNAEQIPFNRPEVPATAVRHLRDSLDSGHMAGDGPFTAKCEQLLTELLRAHRVLLTGSCTHALEMAALLLDIGIGDEVVVPSFTFPSTANAFALRGARLVFSDIRPDTLNLDESLLESLISDKTRAVVPVHYAGVSCHMDFVRNIVESRGIQVIEDNAQGLFARYRGRWLGTIGCLGAQSFHATKNIQCGEGGALVINDPALAARAEVIREKGTNRTSFLRGHVSSYTWTDIGSSYLLSDILAALLYAQLRRWQEVQGPRRRVWERYNQELMEWAASNHVRVPSVPGGCEPAYHLFYLVMPSPVARTAFISHLASGGIEARTHYRPLHLSEMGRRLSARRASCPVTEHVSERLVRLPMYSTLTEAEQSRVIARVRAFNCALPGRASV